MRWGNILDPWDWLFQQLSNPGVAWGLAFLIAGAALLLFGVSRVIRWLMSKHLSDAVGHLLHKYDRRYRFQGIKREPLLLIASCTAWIFALKVLAELLEPFVTSFWAPDLSERHFGVARYDWVVLSSLTLLVVLFWMRFHRDVRRHDAGKPDPSNIRKRWRTIPLFARPTVALLLLMFLPDIGRFSSALAAGWLKATIPAFASARAASDEPRMQRHFAGELQVKAILVPRERIASEK